MKALKILSFILIYLFTTPLFAQENEAYDVLEVVSKNTKYKLNRNIIIDQKVKKDILGWIEYDCLLESIYDGLWIKENVENFISKDDVIELREKINLNHSLYKWRRSPLRKRNIKVTRHKIGNRKRISLYQTSDPVFFKNKRFAMIYISDWCGMECGSGNIEFYYKNDNNVWEYFGYIMMWIS